MLFDFIDVDVVDADFAVGDVIEAGQEVGNRGFPCSSRPNKRHLLARFGIKGDVMENRLFGDVAKVHIVHIDLAFHPRISRFRSIRMGVLPRPFSRIRIAFFWISIRIFASTHQGDIAFVDFARFVHNPKDAGGSSHCHDKEVNLVCNHHNRHGEGTP